MATDQPRDAHAFLDRRRDRDDDRGHVDHHRRVDDHRRVDIVDGAGSGLELIHSPSERHLPSFPATTRFPAVTPGVKEHADFVRYRTFDRGLPDCRPERPRIAHRASLLAPDSRLPSVARAGPIGPVEVASNSWSRSANPPRGHLSGGRTMSSNAIPQMRRGSPRRAAHQAAGPRWSSARHCFSSSGAQAAADRAGRRGQDQAQARTAAGRQGRGHLLGALRQHGRPVRGRKIKDWDKRGQAVYDALTAAAATSQKDARDLLEKRGRRVPVLLGHQRDPGRGRQRALAADLAAEPRRRGALPDLRLPAREAHQGRATSRRPTRSSGASPTSTPTTSGTSTASTARASSSPTSTPACSTTTRRWSNQYRGNNGDGTFDHDYNWFDAAGTCADAPCDTNGHGTPHDGHDGRRRRRHQPDRRRSRREVDRRQRLLPLRRGPDQLRRVDARADRPRGREPRTSSKRPNIINNSWGIAGPQQRPVHGGRPGGLGGLRHLRQLVQRQQRTGVPRRAVPRAAGSSTTRSAPTTSTTPSPASPAAAPARTARSSRTSRPPASTCAPAFPATATAPSTVRRWPHRTWPARSPCCGRQPRP